MFNDLWGGAWGAVSAWGGSWGWSWGPLHQVDEPVTGGKRRPRVVLPLGVYAPVPKRWIRDDDEALLLCGAL